MMPTLSANTRAILLLTAPLIARRGVSPPDLLSPGEYGRLARHLREMQCQPADLLASDAGGLLRACETIIGEGRLARLLSRGFLLSQVVENWSSRSIWVISRADAEYPSRLKTRLREKAPAVLYGCGKAPVLESGGLAVVGSRHVDDALIDYTMRIGRLAAHAGKKLISGGARGVDQAAMRGALESGGMVVGVLGDSLQKTVMAREQRDLLMGGQLVLVSPYDPSAGFSVGNAMQRNKVIYALSDAALVVSSDLNKGGTWAGAVEQLEKLRCVPVYVRSEGAYSAGLDGLRRKGATPWPNPQDADSLEMVFDVVTSAPPGDTPGPSLSGSVSTSPGSASDYLPIGGASVPCDFALSSSSSENSESPPVLSNERRVGDTPHFPAEYNCDGRNPAVGAEISPADALFSTVREVIGQLLKSPMKDDDVANALGVSAAQAKAWLQRLVTEGVLEKRRRPAGYVLKSSRLF